MNRFTSALAVLMLLWNAGGNAQEENSSVNYEQLKSYEALIGTWVHHGVVSEGGIDDTPAETPMTITTNWKWIVDRTAVEVDWEFAIEDRPRITGKSIIQWDLAEETPIITFLGGLGGYQHGMVDIDPVRNTWTSTMVGKGGQGQAVSGSTVITLMNPDQFSLQSKDRQGGRFTGDGPERIFQRVKPTRSAAAYFEYWKPLTGTWKTRTSVGGNVVEGTYVYEPLSTAYCYSSVSTTVGQPDRHDIHGYDPEHDCWLVPGFTSDGGRETSYLRVANMDEVPQLASGAKGTYQSVKIAPDGTVSRTEGHWTWVEFDSPRFVLELRGIVTDGEPQPDIEVTMERAACDDAQASREHGESLIEEYIRTFAGRFVCDAVADEDIEGYMSKGESVRTEVTRTPFPDQTGLNHAWHLEKDGVIRGRSHGVTVWDPAEQVIKHYASATGGFHVEESFMKRDGAWHGQLVITYPDGRKASSSSVVNIADDGQTHTVSVSDRVTHTGETLEPTTDTWRRISKSQEMLAEHVGWLIGDWTAEVDVPGVGEVTVDHSFKWIARGEVIQLDLNVGEWEGLSMIFYDPADGSIKMWGANSAGGNGQAVMRRNGDSLVWTNTVFTADGKKSVNDFIYEKGESENEFRVIFFDQRSGEQQTVTLLRK